VVSKGIHDTIPRLLTQLLEMLLIIMTVDVDLSQGKGSQGKGVVVSQNIRDMTTILPLHVVGFILTEIAISFRLTEIHHTRVRGAKEEEEVLDVAIQYSK